MENQLIIEIKKIFADAECKTATPRAMKIFEKYKYKYNFMPLDKIAYDQYLSEIAENYDGTENARNLGVDLLFSPENPFLESFEKKFGFKISVTDTITEIYNKAFQDKRKAVVQEMQHLVKTWDILPEEIFSKHNVNKKLPK